MNPMGFSTENAVKRPGRQRVTPRTGRLALMAGLLVLLLGLSVGCTVSLGYRFADWLVLWKIDQYFDLTSDQKTFLERRLQAILARHRQEALPRYEAFLLLIKEKAQDGLTREEVDWIVMTSQFLREDLLNRLVADGAAFLETVQEEQVHHLQQVLWQENIKLDRLAGRDATRRLTERATATVEFLEDWLGSLTRDQRLRITALSLALPDLQPVWVEHHKQRQREMLDLLRSGRNAAFVEPRLRDWLLRPVLHASVEYQEAVVQQRNAITRMVLTIDQMITDDQRRHALEKLQQLIDDIHDLASA